MPPRRPSICLAWESHAAQPSERCPILGQLPGAVAAVGGGQGSDVTGALIRSLAGRGLHAACRCQIAAHPPSEQRDRGPEEHGGPIGSRRLGTDLRPEVVVDRHTVDVHHRGSRGG
jgi:hypothetical protein